MSRAACVGLSLGLAACSHHPAPPRVAEVPSPPPPTESAPATDCAEHPLAPATVGCALPPADVVARAQAEVARVSLPSSQGGFDPQLAWSCELARGWLVSATFEPVPAFHGDPVRCAPADDNCGTAATWLVPARGALQRQPALALAGNLDVDGDGRAETLTTDGAGATTVWFDAGRTPVVVRAPGAPVPWHGGHVWLALDGDATRGFVRDTAIASRVTPAGVALAPDVIAALWPTTVAARCPVADVIAPGPTPPPAPACPNTTVREPDLIGRSSRGRARAASSSPRAAPTCSGRATATHRRPW